MEWPGKRRPVDPSARAKDPGSLAVGDAVADTEARVESRQRRRGKGAGRATRPPAPEDQPPPAAAVDPQLAAQIDRLFEVENWKALVRAPADLRLVQTGRPYWKLTDEEVNTLALSGSLTARYFMAVDPKWLALCIFLMNAGFIYGRRIVEDVRILREEQAADERAAGNGHGDRGTVSSAA